MFQSVMQKLGFGGTPKIVLGSAIEGRAVPLSEVRDPTFGEEILGKGVAVEPSVGRVVAPIDGTIAIMFETKHAISLISQEGVEILIHVGLETVELKGQHFITHVQVNDQVKKGDLLLEFDIEKIKEAGYSVITPLIICNTPDYKSIEAVTGKEVKTLDDILYIQK